MPGNSRICGSLAVAHDRQSESAKDSWIHRGIFRRGERIGWRSPQPLVEVQSDI